jgi:hypothetical protein
MRARNVRKYGNSCNWPELQAVNLESIMLPISDFKILRILDVCCLAATILHQNSSLGAMTSAESYGGIPLLARLKLKTTPLDVLHSSNVLCHPHEGVLVAPYHCILWTVDVFSLRYHLWGSY